MKVWLIRTWDSVRSSFWFVPLSMMLGACIAVFLLIQVDQTVTIASDGPLTWLRLNAATARSTLSLLAGTMITLSGVVFSLTMVTLSLTSSQFGSRLLRTAMTDFVTQLALGAFLSTSLYCILVLRFIPAEADSPFVPHLTVFGGGLMVFVSLVMMIWFVHHLGITIQAQTVVAQVGADLDQAISDIFPERLGQPHPDSDAADAKHETELGSRCDSDSPTIAASSEGYLQAINVDGLLNFAVQHDLVLKLLYRPGDFVIQGTALIQFACSETEHAMDLEQAANQLNACFMTGNSRTPRQDVCCAINELVEVAVRALSPGINDPFTAMACLDRMTASLSRLLQRDLPAPHRVDANNNLRVVAPVVTIEEILDVAFNQIRLYGSSDVAVSQRMMESLVLLHGAADRQTDRESLLQHAELLARNTESSFKESQDRERIHHSLTRLKETLA